MMERTDRIGRLEAGVLVLIFLAFALISTNCGVVGTTRSSTQSSTTTNAPTSPATSLSISGVGTSGISASSVTISWTTNVAATSQVDYGTTTSYGSTTTADNNFSTTHSQTITGLTPATTFHFRAHSRDAANHDAYSPDQTFATSSSAPVSSILEIQNVRATAMSTQTVAVTWSTTAPGTSQVEFGTTTAYGSFTTFDTTLTTAHSQLLNGLSPSTSYHLRVHSKDSSGQDHVGDDVTATTMTPTVSSLSNLPTGIGWHELKGPGGAGTSLKSGTNGTQSGVSLAPTTPAFIGSYGDPWDFASTFHTVVEDWNGAILDSRRDRMIMVTNGGHGDYAGNECYMLDLTAGSGDNSGKMVRCADPTVPTACFPGNPGSKTQGSACPSINNSAAKPEALPAYQVASICRGAGCSPAQPTGTVVITTNIPHGWATGQKVQVGATGANTCYTGVSMDSPQGIGFPITVVDSQTISYVQTGASDVTTFSPQAGGTQCNGQVFYSWASPWGFGAPQSRHTYGQVEYDPVRDRIMLRGGALTGTGNGSGVLWTLDNVAQLGDITAGAQAPHWTWQTDCWTTGTDCASGFPGQVMVFDPTTQDYFLFDSTGGGSFYRLSSATFAMTRLSQFGSEGPNFSGVIDPSRKLFFAIGCDSSCTGTVLAACVDANGCSTFGMSYGALTAWTNSDGTCSGLLRQSPGLAFDPVTNTIVGISENPNPGANPSTYYVVTPHANRDITCASATPAGGPTEPSVTTAGVYGRFRYVPDCDCFAYIPTWDQNAFILRLR